MKKLLIGYIAVTLFGLILMGLGKIGVVKVSLFSVSLFTIAATLPEYFFIGSFFADHKLGQFRVDMIPMFLFVFTAKFICAAGVGHTLSSLWNIKLEDIS